MVVSTTAETVVGKGLNIVFNSRVKDLSPFFEIWTIAYLKQQSWNLKYCLLKAAVFKFDKALFELCLKPHLLPSQILPVLFQKHLQDAAFSSNYIGVQQALDKTKEKSSEIKGLKRKVEEAKRSKVTPSLDHSWSVPQTLVHVSPS